MKAHAEMIEAKEAETQFRDALRSSSGDSLFSKAA
jgi:hypothetical protein